MNARTETALLQALEPQTVSLEVLQEKYLKGAERTKLDMDSRIARAVAAVETEDKRAAVEAEFLTALQSGFIPAGRINSAAGTDLQATLINCFVQPVGDSISEDADGKPGIYKALTQAAETMRRGGGVGYDFSEIRPRGAWVGSTNSHASGPVSYMRVYDRSCETVESAGSRRGAQMGVLRCDHPDIAEFIVAKQGGDLKNFNISIGVTDALMEAVMADGTFDLVHVAKPGQALIEAGATQRADGLWIYRTIQARQLWDTVMRATYNAAEPGVLFLDRINQENNLHYCETIEASNPCGEQTLPSYGCCCLGSLNLTSFVRMPFTNAAFIDLEAIKAITKIAVRFLDNVLDATMWPLTAQQEEAINKRRIGLGFMGLGSAMPMLNIAYDSETARALAAQIAEAMRDAAYEASISLAEEKGSFPLLNADLYLQSGFAKRLPEAIRDGIKTRGLRNSHLLSIAPTGTIALALADNASNGIEPPFSWTYERKKRMPDGSTKSYIVEDHAVRVFKAAGGDANKLPAAFVSANDMTAMDHMLMLKVVQPFIDAAISKTVNVPEDYPFDDFKNLYLAAWEANLKGITTYRPNSITGSVLAELPKEGAKKPEDAVQAPAQADADLLTMPMQRRPDGDLPAVNRKIEYWTAQGERKSIYIGVSFATFTGMVGGKEVSIERPIEVFPLALTGEGQQWITSHMVQMSTAMRYGAPVADMLKNMRDTPWSDGLLEYGFVEKADGTRMPRKHGSDVAMVGYAIQQILAQRGFLDSEGNQIPLSKLVQGAQPKAQAIQTQEPATTPTASGQRFKPGTGKTCPACGSNDLHKVDGCTACQHCGHEGGCGG